MTEHDAIQPILRFLNPDDGGILYECQWTGDWPPPAAFRVYIGTQSGMVKVMPDLELLTEGERDAARADSIITGLWVRDSYSVLTDDELAEFNAGGVARIMRGAEYIYSAGSGAFPNGE